MVLAGFILGFAGSIPDQGSAYDVANRARVLYEDIVARDLDKYSDEADHFVECGDAVVPYLARLVQSNSSSVWSIGFSAIDKVKPRSIAGVLLQLTSHEETRIDAIYSLGRLGERSVVPVLRRRLEQPRDEEEKWALVAALTMLDDESAVTPMIGMAEKAKYLYYCDMGVIEKKYEGPESFQVIEALQLTTPAIRLSVLSHLLDSKNPTHRLYGIWLSTTDKGPRIREKLYELLYKDGMLDPDVVRTLVELNDLQISSISRKFMIESKKFISYMTPLEVLVKDGTTESADVVLKWLPRIPRDYNRIIHLLTGAKEPRLVDVLMQELWNDEELDPESVLVYFDPQPLIGPLLLDWYQQVEGLSLAAMASKPYVYKHLGLTDRYVELASEKSAEVRREVAEGLQMFTFGIAREPLSKLATDQDARVRDTAKKTLRSFGVAL